MNLSVGDELGDTEGKASGKDQDGHGGKAKANGPSHQPVDHSGKAKDRWNEGERGGQSRFHWVLSVAEGSQEANQSKL